MKSICILLLHVLISTWVELFFCWCSLFCTLFKDNFLGMWMMMLFDFCCCTLCEKNIWLVSYFRVWLVGRF